MSIAFATENLRLPRQSLYKDQDLNFNLGWIKYCVNLYQGKRETKNLSHKAFSHTVLNEPFPIMIRRKQLDKSDSMSVF